MNQTYVEPILCFSSRSSPSMAGAGGALTCANSCTSENNLSVAEGQLWCCAEMMPGQGSIPGQHNTWESSQGQQLYFQLPDPPSPLLLVKYVSIYVLIWSLTKEYFLESSVPSHHLFHCFVTHALSCMLFPVLFEVCNQSRSFVFSSQAAVGIRRASVSNCEPSLMICDPQVHSRDLNLDIPITLKIRQSVL